MRYWGEGRWRLDKKDGRLGRGKSVAMGRKESENTRIGMKEKDKDEEEEYGVFRMSRSLGRHWTRRGPSTPRRWRRW
jgi:hypothetical protein